MNTGVRACWPALLLGAFVLALRAGGPAGESQAALDCIRPSHTVEALERCASAAPDDAPLVGELGAAYESAGRSEEAERAYRQSLAADPHDGDVRLRLGSLLLAKGDRAGAHEQALAAAAILPGSEAAARLLDETGALSAPGTPHAAPAPRTPHSAPRTGDVP